MKEVDGVKMEPFENVIFDVEDAHQGGIMEQMGHRKGDVTNMEPDGKGRIRIEATIPARRDGRFNTDAALAVWLHVSYVTFTVTHLLHDPALVRVFHVKDDIFKGLHLDAVNFLHDHLRTRCDGSQESRRCSHRFLKRARW